MAMKVGKLKHSLIKAEETGKTSQLPTTVYVHLIFEEVMKYGGGTGMM